MYTTYCVTATIDPGTKVQRTIKCYRKIQVPAVYETPSDQKRVLLASLKKVLGFSVQESDGVYRRRRPQRGGVQWVSIEEAARG